MRPGCDRGKMDIEIFFHHYGSNFPSLHVSIFFSRLFFETIQHITWPCRHRFRRYSRLWDQLAPSLNFFSPLALLSFTTQNSHSSRRCEEEKIFNLLFKTYIEYFFSKPRDFSLVLGGGFYTSYQLGLSKPPPVV
jgi:hypothetical protein